MAVAVAAGLVAKAARLSRGQITSAQAIAHKADALRDRAIALSQADAAAFQAVITARRQCRLEPSLTASTLLASALKVAFEVPHELAEVAVEVCELAVVLIRNGNPQLEGDALSAGLLAEAGGRAAIALAIINVGLTEHNAVIIENQLQARLADIKTILLQAENALRGGSNS